MKKSIITIYLSISTLNFAFWPINEAFLVERLENDLMSFCRIKEPTKNDQPRSWFLYDYHTSIALIGGTGYISYLINEEGKNPSFFYLKSPFKPSIEPCPILPNNYNSNTKLKTIIENLIKILPLKKMSTNIHFFGHEQLREMIEWSETPSVTNKKVPIFYRKYFSSLSGVQINNTMNGVILSQNGKSIELGSALKKHFEKNYIASQIPNVPSKTEKSSFENIELGSDPLNKLCLTEKDVQLLHASDILRAWCLIPKKSVNDKTKKIEPQIIGLAKDRYGRLFPWTTHLGQDISILMKYCKKINNKPSSYDEDELQPLYLDLLLDE